MSSSNVKVRLVVYMTPEEKDRVRDRAAKLGKDMGTYLAELVTWDIHLDLFRRARNQEITQIEAE